MIKEPIVDKFIIPRGSCFCYPDRTNWLYKDGQFTLLGYILHNFFEVPVDKLDGHVYIDHVSDRTGEEYKGFTKYLEKEDKYQSEIWIGLFNACTSLDRQIMCVSKYSPFQCSYEIIETTIEL